MGILGVNLIHAALYEAAPVALLRHLLDSLSSERIDVDLIEFSGPAFAGVDNRLMSLELVHCGLTEAAMFTAEGKVVQPAEVFYKRPILVVRGRFRPITNQTVDMLHCALDQFMKEPANQGEDILVVAEMTLRHLQQGDVIDDRDYLDRVDIIRTLGRPVMVSSFGEYYRLAQYLHRHTHKLIGLVMGAPHAPRAVRGEVLHAPGRRHPRIVRADVQERPEGLRLSAAGPRGRRHRDRGRFPRCPPGSSTSSTSWSRAGTSRRSATTSRNS